MSTATITSKGQITIPISVRNDLKIESGDKLEFIKVKDGLYEIMSASKDIAFLALKQSKKLNADFSDALIFVTSKKNGCKKTLTFDKKAQKVGMELLS